MKRTLLLLALGLYSGLSLAWNGQDEDGDGIPNQLDNCAYYANADQADADLNGIGDACEAAANPANDADSDGVPDLIDNCPADANSDQADDDHDMLGNACDDSNAGFKIAVYPDRCASS